MTYGFRAITLTPDEMAELDDGQEWYHDGDEVVIYGYTMHDERMIGSPALLLDVNDYTHDNWITLAELQEDYPRIAERLLDEGVQ